MSLPPLKARRLRATRLYALRVSLLLALMGVIAYAAWFAPWAQPVPQVKVEATR